MNENLGDFILSVHTPDTFIDPVGEVLDTSAKSGNPFVQAVLDMMKLVSVDTNSDPNSEESD